MSNLATRKPEISMPLNLLDPKTGEEFGLRLFVYGFEHTPLKNVQRSLQDERAKKAAKGKPPTTAEMENIRKTLARHAVHGWEWTKPIEVANWNDEQPEYSSDLIGEMVQISWITEQIDDFLGDDKNFFIK